MFAWEYDDGSYDYGEIIYLPGMTVNGGSGGDPHWGIPAGAGDPPSNPPTSENPGTGGGDGTSSSGGGGGGTAGNNNYANANGAGNGRCTLATAINMLDPNNRVPTAQLLREVAEKLVDSKMTADEKAKLARGEITRDQIADRIAASLEDGLTKSDIKTGLIPVLEDKYNLDLKIRNVYTDPEAQKSGLASFEFLMNQQTDMMMIYKPKNILSLDGHAVMIHGNGDGTVTIVDPAATIPTPATMSVADAYALFANNGSAAPGYLVVPESTPASPPYYGP